ncbi:hypothetical protein [Anatilimnocola floriformis]|uniref:hypothetical protein n=1 Tax=Anatilimnocola floriformis TaxID=2948575 RepID=UPI0020C57364|nr:hypothetical protein [Anatilimnocola floriformis]
MGYYVRAFCKASQLPSPAVLTEWLAGRAPEVHLDVEDPAASDWSHLELVYHPDRQPIVVELSGDEMVSDEVEEFIELIGKPGKSAHKRHVLDHLAQTKMVVACQLLGDIDDAGYEANYQFLSYFVEHCDALIQADGEGFYDGDKVIVRID